MLGRKNKRAPMPKGQGAAAAKQMGLFMDFNPEEMMDMEGNFDDPDLEAEFAAIVGTKTSAGGRSKPKGKTPLPMEDIEKMAAECMKEDYNEEEDEDLENDEDLLAELQEVVGEEEAEDEGIESPSCPISSEVSPAETPESPQKEVKVSSTPGSLQHTLEERIGMYKAAIANAKASGESSKARRYERGLKTLETMLGSVKKGRKIDEGEIPPPVACGAPSAPSAAPGPAPEPEPQSVPTEEPGETPGQVQAASPETGPSSEEVSSTLATPDVSSLASLEETSEEKVAEPQAVSEQKATKAMLVGRQKEYKLAAMKAKQEGDLEGAKLFLKTSKKFDAVIEALENGQPIDLSNMPPPPGGTDQKLAVKVQGTMPSPSPAKEAPPRQPAESTPPASVVPAAPPQPKDVLEALEQRLAKYQEACAQAKASGDDRKARMHDRIAKQYQSAIRAHKAGRAVNYEELPVPPGFPPIPGHAGAGAEQGFAAVLEAANKLASDEVQEAGDEEEEEAEEPPQRKPPVAPKPKKPTLAVPPTVQDHKPTPSPSPERHAKKEGLSPTAQQQVDFLEGRRKQYMKAALQAKQRNDMEQAKQFLRTAKGFEPMIEAAKGGKPVDISKVPSPPGDEDDDFILVHHKDIQMSEKAEEVYSQLAKLLKEQYEKCMTYSKQFTHLGNIKETTKFEKMAESCKKNLEILKLAQAQGLDPPKHRFEERTYSTVRIFPELSSTEMVVVIVKGMNLPAPHGIATNDLDAFVRFEFPYPSSEQPQKHKTNVIKNTNCPEYNQSFTLTINRNHRGFRRVIQSKGLKLEVLHKGGFLRSDKPLGTAHLKLEKLDTESEVREIVEVIDGRKATGGRLEVRVRLREPLSGQDLQTTTERWLVLDQPQVVL
ncbi:coiled-coil and C2 domain-containing protein 1B isoform X1 [Megalops cyprinoides]|uniref:coiled-coil and C2 domain-containing protein 1B isoform X1 n=1 Tax=Megalops cyprinoides TaxID=118141 RepID=UPI0018647C1E|nr:coiled-coil and C2 domain-containing protein 1B isoform X1 [Megalops cyprinoides]